MTALDSTTTLRAPDHKVEETFGKYRLIKKLAAGGMAQIYLAAIDGPDGFTKTCVIKKILPELANRTDFADMFITEAKVAALLSHPNIIQIFDFGKLDEKYYLAMEFINGPSLEQLMIRARRAGRALGPKLATHLGIPLCDALTYLEQMTTDDGEPMNLVHRDITPGNVLFSRTAQVKLTDFGVVKTDTSEKETQAGVVKGKFAYMSPEQAMGRPLDHRSDIFSLAVVLYEVATGHRLWKRGPPLQMIAAVVDGEVPRPTKVCKNFPLALEKILLKALEKNPDERYPSAADMMADLNAFRQSQRWEGGRRELSQTMALYFPESHGSNVYRLPSVSAIPEVTSREGSHNEAEEEEILEGSVVENISIEETEASDVFATGNVLRDALIAVIVVMLMSAVLWFFVLG